MQSRKKIAFETLGCKLNFAETSAIARTVEDFERVDFRSEADVYVINTCTVTSQAERKLKEMVKRIKRQSPQAKVVALGCLAQRDPELTASLEGIDLVLGMAEKFKLKDYLPGLIEGKLKGILAAEPVSDTLYLPAYSAGDRTRAFLKVQDGCDYPCTYCIIPEARGKGRNPTVASLVAQAEEIAVQGIKEIVITGVNIGTFKDLSTGKDLRFYDLIRALDQVEGIERYRISSIEPNLLTDEIIEFVLERSRAFLPHFHIPLQSGSNEILGKMRRRYRRELYREKVEKIKSINPDAAVGVDVIVGFPGETEELFKETYAFLKDLDASYLHVFSYSDRPGTLASRMPGKVPGKKIKERSRILRDLSKRKHLMFVRSQLGKVRPVLFERSEKSGRMHGFADNYVKVSAPYDVRRVNRVVNVYLEETEGETVKGKIAEP